ncbi:MAG: hypothetical protein SFY67_18140 [Candidatus Melainabacteria bacterium]|nr:hypothetical protein [Candidatus Melainabacteria bacterium]
MLEIVLKDDKKRFLPFEVIEGKIKYDLSRPSKEITVDLVWTTMGKGTIDNYRADSSVISTMGSNRGEGNFRLNAPAGPYSFSGKLISIIWMISCGTENDKEIAEIEIVISPVGREVVV